MMSRYEVDLVDMGNGEHMPLLIDSTTGVGLYEPTAFSALSKRRAERLCDCRIKAAGLSQRLLLLA